MATLVLTAVGTVLGGPVVGLAAGALGLGAGLMAGGGRARQGPRLNDLSVQSSAYGAPLPRLYGTIRASGSVIWAAGIKESSQASGGGKGKPKTTSYSYSASFAVALSARPIRSVKRIWGDGKLMRTAEGEWVIPATMRIYMGGGDDAPDPLIASAEGAGAAPAYRHMAYAVFEDLDLSEFANHIPMLSFEVEADDGRVEVARIIDDLCGEAGFAATEDAAPGSTVHGFGVASSGSVRSALESLAVIDPVRLVDDGVDVRLSLSRGGAAAVIDAKDAGAFAATETGSRPSRIKTERGTAGQTPGELSIAYYDVSRDYQAGLQHAHFGSGMEAERIELPAALSGVEAKALAERKMIDASARRVSGNVDLPWRALAIRPGDIVRLAADAGLWRVSEIGLERWVMELSLERVIQMPVAAMPGADSGRVAEQYALPNGATILHAFELPLMLDETAAGPRIWLATAGAQQGWRRANIAMSANGGASWEAVLTANGASVMGSTVNALGPAGSALWDDRNVLEVELIHDGMWLEGRSDEALLANANFALVDEELIQFGTAEALGERRFRLSHLLRGRRGTEWAAADHAPGGRFILLDPSLVASQDVSPGLLGASLQFRASGPGEDPGAAVPVGVLVRGAALLPPAPVHLGAEKQANGDILLHWVRRSRQGWGWVDGVDAPLAEESELYRLTLDAPGRAPRTVALPVPHFTYSVADQLADGGGVLDTLSMEVAQISAVAGAGMAAAQTFVFSN